MLQTFNFLSSGWREHSLPKLHRVMPLASITDLYKVQEKQWDAMEQERTLVGTRSGLYHYHTNVGKVLS